MMGRVSGLSVDGSLAIANCELSHLSGCDLKKGCGEEEDPTLGAFPRKLVELHSSGGASCQKLPFPSMVGEEIDN